jgi:SHS2 domain-containing protein
MRDLGRELDPKTARPPEHQFVEHGGEERLTLRADNLGDLLAEAGRAHARLQGAADTSPRKAPWRLLKVDAPGPAALLVEWFNELIFQAEHQHWVPTEFRVENATPTSLTMWARGPTRAWEPSRVKAATWHGLEFHPGDGACEAQLVLDV